MGKKEGNRMIYVTQEQYKDALKASDNPINNDNLQQLLSEVGVFEKLNTGVVIHELS